jgi:hypothetical protein
VKKKNAREAQSRAGDKAAETDPTP